MKTFTLINLLLFLTLNIFLKSSENLNQDQNKNKSINSQSISKEASQGPQCTPPSPSLNGSFVKRFTNKISNTVTTVKEKISNLFKETGSWWIRFLTALILGLLLSLTPCIYPMIPITIGILGVNQSTSGLRSFLIASSYALGISVTFALLGFLAAIGSCVFGEIQGSPYFILPLVALLIYFGLSMFDFYEIYIPSFLKPKDSEVKGGSFLSAFIFGAISGTVASPCLSPGLLLILNYVSSLSIAGGIGNYLQGFMLLFVFGIGSSLPLLIIGTFSASAKIMPKAGAWMVEVKKLIGLLLLGMAAYHLSHLENFIPWTVLSRVISFGLIILAYIYYRSIKPYDSAILKVYKIFIAILLFISSFTIIWRSSKVSQENLQQKEISDRWLTDLDKAKELAKKENKLIFIDLLTTICAICKSIDKKILQDPKVIEILEKYYVSVKVYFDLNRANYDKVNKDFGPIRGFPTFLIIDSNNKLIKNMGAEFGELSVNEVVKLLSDLNQNR